MQAWTSLRVANCNSHGIQDFRKGHLMDNISRRSFVSQAAVGVTSFGLLGATASAQDAQLVWKTSDWKLSEFQGLVKTPARIKQVFDVTQISEGRFLNNIKNSFNGLHF